VPQGQLLGSLVQKGLLTGQQMHEFMRELVRDFVLALANAATGAYRFDEDKKFLEVAPLLKVNPFGLILESRRRSMQPVLAAVDRLQVRVGDRLGRAVVDHAPAGHAHDAPSP
jgi:hypothetical protein